MDLLVAVLVTMAITGLLVIGFGVILMGQVGAPTIYKARVAEGKEPSASRAQIDSPAATA